jgi:hypothetical protein
MAKAYDGFLIVCVGDLARSLGRRELRFGLFPGRELAGLVPIVVG